MAALAQDLVALLRQRQAVDLDDVVEHAREDLDDLAVFRPVELGVVGEGVAHEAREVHRAEQAGAVGRQRLLAAGVGGADVLAPPVVVHLVDAVDQDEARLREIVGGRHDDVPHAARRQRLVDAAGDEARVVGDVLLGVRPLAPHELRGVGEVRRLGLELLARDRERELPVAILAHGAHELVGDEQREIELAQPAVLALGADEFHGVRVADVERAHLRAAATAGRRHGEAHLVVDIHERQRAGGVGARARHVRPARTQRRELVADAAAGLQRQARLVHLLQDVVHRVADRAGHGAVDGGRRRLVLLRAGVGRDAARRDRAAAQRPQEALVPVLAERLGLDVGQRAGDTLVGVVHRLVDGLPALGDEAILLVPDVERGFLEGNAVDVLRYELHDAVHADSSSPKIIVATDTRGCTNRRSDLRSCAWILLFVGRLLSDSRVP